MTFYDTRNRTAVWAVAAAQDGAQKLGIEVVAQQVTSPEEMRDRLHTLAATNAEALFFVSGISHTDHIRGADHRGGKRPALANRWCREFRAC